MNMKLIGHRGYGPTHMLPWDDPLNTSYPENSLAAFSHALRSGADGIELDVQVTRDGQAIVLHDKYLARHTPQYEAGHLPDFYDLDYADIKRISIGGEHVVPSLDEVLTLVADFKREIIINFDVKDKLCVEPVLEGIASMPPCQGCRFIVSSYDWDLLRGFREKSDDILLVPAIKTLVLFGADNVSMPGYRPLSDAYAPEALQTLKELKAELDIAALDCTFTDLKPQLIDWAAEMRLGLQISTGNFRVDANNADYEALKMLDDASRYQNDIPFVIAKVDEPHLIKQAFDQYVQTSPQSLRSFTL